MSSQTEEEEQRLCGGAAVLLCFVSEGPDGSGLYQLWTLVLQAVHQVTLGPVYSTRALLLPPVWEKSQNRSWMADSQSEQLFTRVLLCFSWLVKDARLTVVSLAVEQEESCRIVSPWHGVVVSCHQTLFCAHRLQGPHKISPDGS
ncbi:hypothetical protein ILYODFUR_024346 [Ilyodon furcidens]|uniref:Uncharacterized protein n=1 Tax=Ilyodon furcidens TaxID=33524 RepID=A0ABV0V8C0_9TELE